MTAPKMSEVFALPLTAEYDSDGWLVVVDGEENVLTVDPIGGKDTIRAINSHDALVEALRSAFELRISNHTEWEQSARAALALADAPDVVRREEI